MAHDSDTKLHWEVEKLMAETRNLSRPFVRQPTFWIGLGTIALSLGTNLVQLNSAERNKQLAEIRTESLRLETTKLEKDKAALEAAVREQRAQLAEVGEELGNQQFALEKLKVELETAGATKEAALLSIAELQKKTTTLGGIVENTSRNLAQVTAPQPSKVPRDIDKATELEAQAYQALAAKDFTKAQRLFQASENAANGFRYSYEWARLLKKRAPELATAEGQREVMQFAVSKGYASYAPEELRRRIQALAQ